MQEHDLQQQLPSSSNNKHINSTWVGQDQTLPLLLTGYCTRKTDLGTAFDIFWHTYHILAHLQ